MRLTSLFSTIIAVAFVKASTAFSPRVVAKYAPQSRTLHSVTGATEAQAAAPFSEELYSDMMTVTKLIGGRAKSDVPMTKAQYSELKEGIKRIVNDAYEFYGEPRPGSKATAGPATAPPADTTMRSGQKKSEMFPDKPTGSLSELYSSGGGAARRQADAARRMLEEGSPDLTEEQEEKRLAYKHAMQQSGKPGVAD